MAKKESEGNILAAAAGREKTIIRTSILGIAANVFLAAFKAVIGLSANSVAIISDAVNNITDALSSVITIVGTKLAGKAPDKKHPLGYGRIEYFSALIVSAIVLYAGITTVVDSIKKIIHPEDVNYSITSLIILAAAIVVKLVLGAYTKKKGKDVNSGSLTASGQDAFQDAILSASVLASAVVYMLWKVNLEAYVGAVIGLFIVKAGVEMILEALNEMLGSRADSELSKSIREVLLREPEVHGVYDLFIHNYGPDKNIASVHVEVLDTLNAHEIDTLTRKLQLAVYSELGVILQAVGIYSINTANDKAANIREDIRRRIFEHEGVLQFHGFYLDEEQKFILFDIILDFAIPDRKALYQQICQEIQEAYPEYRIQIALDVDISD